MGGDGITRRGIDPGLQGEILLALDYLEDAFRGQTSSKATDVVEFSMRLRQKLLRRSPAGPGLYTAAHLNAILDASVDGIVTIDDQGRIQTFNPAAERMFGYEAAEVSGRNVSMLMPLPYADEHDLYIANFIRTGEAKVIGTGREVRGRRKDGSTFPVFLSIGDARVGSDRTFTASLRDLSESKGEARGSHARTEPALVGDGAALGSGEAPTV